MTVCDHEGIGDTDGRTLGLIYQGWQGQPQVSLCVVLQGGKTCAEAPERAPNRRIVGRACLVPVDHGFDVAGDQGPFMSINLLFLNNKLLVDCDQRDKRKIWRKDLPFDRGL